MHSVDGIFKEYLPQSKYKATQLFSNFECFTFFQNLANSLSRFCENLLKISWKSIKNFACVENVFRTFLNFIGNFKKIERNRVVEADAKIWT